MIAQFRRAQRGPETGFSGIGTVLNGILAGPLGAWDIPYLTVGLFLILAAGLAVAARRGGGRSGAWPPGQRRSPSATTSVTH